jgi:hypothetical protein
MIEEIKKFKDCIDYTKLDNEFYDNLEVIDVSDLRDNGKLVEIKFTKTIMIGFEHGENECEDFKEQLESFINNLNK